MACQNEYDGPSIYMDLKPANGGLTVHLLKKNWCISGPVKFELMLFKGQLCL